MNILQFYQDNSAQYTVIISKLKKQLITLSMVRFTVFLLAFYLAYHFRNTTKTAVLLFVIGIALFLFLVSKYENLRTKLEKQKALKAINDLEIEVLNGTVSKLENGNEYSNPTHDFSYDIDLFGANSFFQYLNRTETKVGKKLLAETLTSNNTDAIEAKQESIQELVHKTNWAQDFRAVASLIHTKVDTYKLLNWLKSYHAFIPKYMRYLPAVFSVLTVLTMLLSYLGYVESKFVYILFAIGLAITGKFLKNTTKLYHDVSQLKETFVQNQQLIYLIENTEFNALHLKQKKNAITIKNEKASELLTVFSKALERFDYRNNIIFALFGNGLFLWDLRQAYHIENWIAANKEKVANWFEVIAYFDAQISLGNYAFNHQDYVFPTINDDVACIKASLLGHPLLNASKRITNDFTIANSNFHIITGANMAGKSTFLRTIALTIVMANTGLPVCAKSIQYNPIKLITSMRTSDSLAADESYFFSELKRLKFIVDKISKARYFIILDEILKGTNSTDKAEGSYQFIKRLLTTKATGLIATHDLSLCKLAEESAAIKNYYFDAEIVNDELFFDYTLKKGICQNMNASFLLHKMGIV